MLLNTIDRLYCSDAECFVSYRSTDFYFMNNLVFGFRISGWLCLFRYDGTRRWNIFRSTYGLVFNNLAFSSLYAMQMHT